MVDVRRLHENWQFAWCPHGQADCPEQAATLRYFPASVPGCTAEDLLRQGVVPDPFIDARFRDSYWCESQDFWYRCRFSVDDLEEDPFHDIRRRLKFDGLDTYAVIWLNNHRVGEAASMFMRHSFPVCTALIPGVNELYICLKSPVREAAKEAAAWGIDQTRLTAAFETTERLPARKMQMSYGWDNHPRIVMSGIFRNVELVTEDGPCIADTWLRTVALAPDGSSATVRGEILLNGNDADLTMSVMGQHNDGGFSCECAVPRRDSRVVCEFVVQKPALWWPNGYGDQALYDVTIELRHDGGLVDSWNMQFGIRVITVRTSPPVRHVVEYRVATAGHDAPPLDGGDQGAWSHVPFQEPVETDVYPFEFFVNDVPLPIVGANWQPCDAVYSRATPERIRALLTSARDMGLNMIRVWGGGYVELPEFYDTCSRLGLLVWQDFLFASGIYPQARLFLERVETEARDIVRRLRAYTCLAAWCGDNESDMSNHDHGRDPADNEINHHILPMVTAELDPGRYYHPSSPWGVEYPRSPWSGDNRNWGPWSPSGNYLHIRQEEARFISEGGAYALPSTRAIECGVSGDLRWPLDNWVWNLHGGSTDTFHRSFPEQSVRMWQAFSSMNSLEEAIAVSQFAQAWGAMVLFLHCRRRWPDTGGVLWWKLDDCWPCMDGGIIDYAGIPRTVYHAIKYAVTPRILVFFQCPETDEVELYLVNHTSGELHTRVCSGVIPEPAGLPVAVSTHEVLAAPWSTVHVCSCVSGNGSVPQPGLRWAWAEDPGATDVACGVWSSTPKLAWTLWESSSLIQELWRVDDASGSNMRVVDSQESTSVEGGRR